MFTRKNHPFHNTFATFTTVQGHANTCEGSVFNKASTEVCMCVVSKGGSSLGEPDFVVDLGSTEVPEEIFMVYLTSLGESTYRYVKAQTRHIRPGGQGGSESLSH